MKYPTLLFCHLINIQNSCSHLFFLLLFKSHTMSNLGKTIEILLVEDNPNDVALIKEAFKSQNLPSQIYVAKDGEQALDFIHKQGAYTTVNTPDLVFLDLNLPRKSGQEILKQIKQNEHTRKIPVLILSSSDAPDIVRQCYELQANAYIKKPIEYDGFVKVANIVHKFWVNITRLPSANNDFF